jgi:hypothetical protein
MYIVLYRGDDLQLIINVCYSWEKAANFGLDDDCKEYRRR